MLLCREFIIEKTALSPRAILDMESRGRMARGRFLARLPRPSLSWQEEMGDEDVLSIAGSQGFPIDDAPISQEKQSDNIDGLAPHDGESTFADEVPTLGVDTNKDVSTSHADPTLKMVTATPSASDINAQTGPVTPAQPTGAKRGRESANLSSGGSENKPVRKRPKEGSTQDTSAKTTRRNRPRRRRKKPQEVQHPEDLRGDLRVQLDARDGRRKVQVSAGSMRPTFADAVKRNLLLAVECLSVSGGYSRRQQDELERGLMQLIPTALQHGIRPHIDGVDRSNGRFVVRCQDEETRAWVAREVPSMNFPWKGSGLYIAHPSEVPSRHARVWIPYADITPSAAMELLKQQNEGLDTSRWAIVQTKPEGRQLLRLRVSQDSVPVLQRLGYKPYLRLRKVHVRLQET